MDNIIGQKIGFLTYRSYSEKTHLYTARCRCGRSVHITPTQARHGSVHACSECMKVYFPTRFHDITNCTYGALKVLYPDVTHGKSFNRRWRCRCIHCGKTLSTTAGPLLTGQLFACPFCGFGNKLSDALEKDFSLRGQTMGLLSVRYQPASQCMDGNDDWICQCGCGTSATYTRKELLLDRVADCGCGCAKIRHIENNHHWKSI